MNKSSLDKVTRWFSNHFRSVQLVDYAQELMFLDQERRYFESVIGGWPTRIKSESQRREIINRWQKTIKRANRLATLLPDNQSLLWLVAELHRMGHNADIPNVLHLAIEIYERIIADNPQSFETLFSLARAYLNAVAGRAAEAEQLLLRAKEIAPPKFIPDITEGLFHACLYQQKKAEAIMYLKSYLSQRPDDTKMAKMLEGVKNGESGVIFEPLSAR